MTITLCAVFFLLLGLIVFNASPFYSIGELVGMILSFLGGATLIAVIISLCMAQIDGHSHLQRIKAFRHTLHEARESENMKLENAAILERKSKHNETIRVKKYWNDTMLDWWVPDEYNNVKPIQ